MIWSTKKMIEKKGAHRHDGISELTSGHESCKVTKELQRRFDWLQLKLRLKKLKKN